MSSKKPESLKTARLSSNELEYWDLHNISEVLVVASAKVILAH